MVEDDDYYIKKMRVLVNQTRNDVDFEENGLTDENLDMQLHINQIKEEYDIVDDDEVIFIDKDFKEFVQ